MADDEHNTDIGILRYMLDSCRIIIEEQRAIIVDLRSGSPTKTDGEMRVVIEGQGQLPCRTWDGDAGFDLFVSEPAFIRPGAFVDVECSVRLELPAGMWGLVIGRSSTLRKRGLMVNQGVIDAGYRGPMYAGVWNLSEAGVQVVPGERLAQLIPMPLLAASVTPQEVALLSEGDRGSDGFGSTGT